METLPSSVLALADGRAGNVRQAEALRDALRALGQAAGTHTDDAGTAPADGDALLLIPAAPWKWTAPRRLPGSAHAFGPAFRAALAAPPEVAIGCGRQAALANRLLRARGSFAVQVLDPRIDPSHWDVVVVPEHDPVRGPNVITLLGALNSIDDAWLAAARAACDRPAALPGPRVALLLGGPTRHVTYGPADVFAACAILAADVERAGGSVLATVSRRTPDAVRDAAFEALHGIPGIRWAGPADGPNPYDAFLGWADHLVCTADSTNQVSEAAATRVPMTVWFAARATGRAAAFLNALHARGRWSPGHADAPVGSPLRYASASASGSDADADADAGIEPLRETTRTAVEIARRFAIRP